MGREVGEGNDPGKKTKEFTAPAVDVGDFSGTTTVIPMAFDRDVRLRRITVVSGALVTGNDVNRININVVDRGLDGLGVVEVANLDLSAGVNLPANDVVDVPVNANGAFRQLARDQVLSLDYQEIGLGLNIPPLKVIVEFQNDHSRGRT